MDQKHSSQNRRGEQDSCQEILDAQGLVRHPREGQDSIAEGVTQQEEGKCSPEVTGGAVWEAP